MVQINRERAVERFQTMIREKTVSRRNGEFDREVFERFLPLLKELYPTVFEVVEAERINEFGILLRWRGRDSSLKPVVTMAHHDVVDAVDKDWEHPPFAAEIHDGVIWGRGSTDTKCIIAAILETMERLIAEGFVPERDIYFASSNCEEYGGDTMVKIVDTFRERGITPWFVLDEGGAIMLELPMGIRKPFAMVAFSEKGGATVRLTAKAKAAIRGVTVKKSAPVQLVEALARLEKSPSAATINPVMEEMLRRFSPHVPEPLKSVLANIKILKPLIKKVMESNSDTAAMIRSSISIINIYAADANRAVPTQATATLRVRIAPHDSFDDILEHIKRTVGEHIDVEVVGRSDPPRLSELGTDSFAYIEKTINKVFPEVGVAPFILDAATDGRHFSAISGEVYRFAPFAVDDDRFNAVHNANERMPVEDYLKMIEFYTEFFKGLN